MNLRVITRSSNNGCPHSLDTMHISRLSQFSQGKKLHFSSMQKLCIQICLTTVKTLKEKGGSSAPWTALSHTNDCLLLLLWLFKELDASLG